MNMNINMTKAIVGVAGIALIGLATYFTKSASCLWALIILGFVLDDLK